MSVVQNKVALVIGGAGFIGSAIVRELLNSGATVVSFDNYIHGTLQNLEDLISLEQLKTICGDVLDDSNLLLEIIRDHRVDYILNCIGDPFIPATNKYPERCYKTNAEGTFHVLQAALESNMKRMIHISTCEVYGVNDMIELSENSTINPQSGYAKSKYIAEKYCNELFSHFYEKKGKMSLTIARLFNCYGPRATHPYIIPEIISQLNESNVLHLGNLTERDFTYVHDTAKALIKVLEADYDDIHNFTSYQANVVNIGSGITYKIDYLVKKLADIMEVPNVKIITDKDSGRKRSDDIPRFVCDSKKIRSYTGWFPEVALEEGLRGTVSWFKENGCQWNFSRND